MANAKSNRNVTESAYRADIDGLRAVAVLSVVFYHAHFDFVPGGFVGVDIFFVISGFLITGIILNHKGSSAEFYPRFYERRIRRLIPPIIPVAIFAVVVAYIQLPPPALEEFAKSLVAFLLFFSNWFFSSISGYFDGSAQEKLLLHTWSLSIEEQFYLIFPLFVLVIRQRSKFAVGAFFVVVFLLSLGLSVYWVAKGETDAAFYNSFARFWEIALGSILACGAAEYKLSVLGKNILGLLGLLLISFAIFGYDHETVFPGLSALAPTVGTAALILSQGSVVNQILATRPMVAIGLISYALYLWHWPIMVFIQISLVGAGFLEYSLGILVAVVLSVISYYAVEQPVRLRKVMPSRRAAYVLFASLVSGLSLAAFAGIKTEGFPERFPATVAEYTAKRTALLREWQITSMRGECWVDHRVSLEPAVDKCIAEDSKNKILLVGDSHAAHLAAGLRAEFPESPIDLLAVDSCTLTLVGANDRPACRELVQWVDASSLQDYRAIFASVRNVSKANIEEFSDRLTRLAAIKPVYVFGPIQFYQPNMPTLYPKLLGSLSKSEIAKKFDGALQVEPIETDRVLREKLAEISGITYVPLMDYSCPKGICDHFDSDGWPILIDNSHLSAPASRELMQKVRPALDF